MTVTLEHAQAHLAELIANLPRGEGLVITQDDFPIAKIFGENRNTPFVRRAGFLKGMIEILQDDEEHLADFHDYMQ